MLSWLYEEVDNWRSLEWGLDALEAMLLRRLPSRLPSCLRALGGEAPGTDRDA